MRSIVILLLALCAGCSNLERTQDELGKVLLVSKARTRQVHLLVDLAGKLGNAKAEEQLLRDLSEQSGDRITVDGAARAARDYAGRVLRIERILAKHRDLDARGAGHTKQIIESAQRVLEQLSDTSAAFDSLVGAGEEAAPYIGELLRKPEEPDPKPAPPEED